MLKIFIGFQPIGFAVFQLVTPINSAIKLFFHSKLIGLAWILSAISLCSPLPVLAADKALIMWIGQYADPRVRIVGADKDAQLAREMAHALGISEENIIERANSELTHQGLKNAMTQLRESTLAGDMVMIYFSGHGRQLTKLNGEPGCSEGLATFEGAVYFDVLLRQQIDALTDKAAKVIMFNDSCFSGGAATKAGPGAFAAEDAPPSPKAFPSWGHSMQTSVDENLGGNAASRQDDTDTKPVGSAASLRSVPVAKALVPGFLDRAAEGAPCGVPSNVMAKAMASSLAGKLNASAVYIAASAADEAAYPTPRGSVATRAWAACLSDSNGSLPRGSDLLAKGLASCAQAWVNQNAKMHQTITLIGNQDLLMKISLRKNL